MLETLDKTASKLIWAAAYNDYNNGNIAKGLLREYTDAVDYADDITGRSVGGRGIGELQPIQRSEFIKMFAPFQVEVNNTYNVLREARRRGGLFRPVQYSAWQRTAQCHIRVAAWGQTAI